MDKQDSAKTFIELPKEELSKVNEDILLEYEYYIKNTDPNYKEKEKEKVVLKTKKLFYNNEIIKFDIKIKDVLFIKIKEK